MDETTAQKKTQELYSAVNNLVRKQNSEIKNLSEKLNVKEDVIRNIMKEERPVATRRKPVSAFDIFCAQRRIDGADQNGNENIDAWLKLATWEKSTYNQVANSYNHEQEYETVRYIEDENERKHTLNQKIKELKHLCREISQGCGYQFLIVGIEPDTNDSISFGTDDLRYFCSDKAATTEQIKDDLINYCISRKPNDQEKMINDNELREHELSEELESTVSSDQKSTNESRMMFTDNSSDHEFTFMVDESTPNSFSSKLNSDFSKKLDVMENYDGKDLSLLIARDVCDVNLESMNLRLMVYRYLENKFQQDTKQKISIPYEDWNKQENFLISGWPRNVEFKEWDILNLNERKKVFMALGRLQFHVRLDSNLSKERRANKKKRFV